MRTRVAAFAPIAILLMFAAVAPSIRRDFIQDIITWDAPPSTPATLPGSTAGPGLPSANHVRVVLIDGLGAEAAHALPTWTSMCKTGLRLVVDVGFPTVSLPVEVSLWSGLTQQQTGVVFRSDRPLVPPLDRRGLPARVPGSIAIAENHGYIVRSLGFAVAEPAAAAPGSSRDAAPDVWAKEWEAKAVAAVASPASLVFVHVLRVDTMGHRKGGASAEYAKAAAESDAILAKLVAADPGARWFLLSDHGHLPTGGHGGEDLDVRQVEHCIVGPGIAARSGGPLHLVDVSRALADSLSLRLDEHSLARPMTAALNAPLGDDAVPPLGLGRGVIAVLLLLAGLAATVWAARATKSARWWLAPWWFVAACLLLVIVRGVPTMSMPMVYAKEDLFDLLDFDKRLMMRSWLIALPLGFAAALVGLRRGASLLHVLVSQLALPFAVLAAALTACGGWAALGGSEVSPMVPHYTAFASPLWLIVSQGSAVVALAVHVQTVLVAFGRRPRSGTAQSGT